MQVFPSISNWGGSTGRLTAIAPSFGHWSERVHGATRSWSHCHGISSQMFSWTALEVFLRTPPVCLFPGRVPRCPRDQFNQSPLWKLELPGLWVTLVSTPPSPERFPLVAFPVQNNWLSRAAKNVALFLSVTAEQSDRVPASAEPSRCDKCESWEWKWDEWFWHRFMSSKGF